MMNFVRKTGRAVGFGLLFFVLRTVQLRSGFDPATGLTLPSAAGKGLAVCLLLAAAAEVVLAWRLSREKVSFRRRFAPVGGMKMVPVMGGLLLAAGSGVMIARAVTGGEIAAAAAGVLGIAAGVGAVLFTQQMGHRVDLSVMPLLPAMFFGVFLVLAEYLPEADDPVLARYYLPVLAAAMTAYAFSQLAGCVQGESSPRWFTPMAELAAALCIGAAADGVGRFAGRLGFGRSMVYAGCALILIAFLALQRREDELPPEEEEMAGEETDAPEAEAGMEETSEEGDEA